MQLSGSIQPGEAVGGRWCKSSTTFSHKPTHTFFSHKLNLMRQVQTDRYFLYERSASQLMFTCNNPLYDGIIPSKHVAKIVAVPRVRNKVVTIKIPIQMNSFGDIGLNHRPSRSIIKYYVNVCDIQCICIPAKFDVKVHICYRVNDALFAE